MKRFAIERAILLILTLSLVKKSSSYQAFRARVFGLKGLLSKRTCYSFHYAIPERVAGVDYVIEDEDDADGSDEDDLLAVAAHEEEVLSLAKQKIGVDAIHLKPLTKSSKQNCVDDLLTQGVVRINDVLSEDSARNLANFVTEELQRSIKEVESDQVDVFSRFSALLSNTNRWDFKLPIDKDDESNIVFNAMREIFRKDGLIGPVLSSIMGDKCELFELASFYTAPGAPRQVVHADTLWTKNPALFTCTIALQDVTEDMGPTLLIPGSHIKEIHKKFDSEDTKIKDNVLLKNPHKLSTLSIGDATVYDSRVLHCGTPNRSDKPRMLFYATFRNPKGPGKDSDFWNVASIRPEYVGKYKLKDFL